MVVGRCSLDMQAAASELLALQGGEHTGPGQGLDGTEAGSPHLPGTTAGLHHPHQLLSRLPTGRQHGARCCSHQALWAPVCAAQPPLQSLHPFLTMCSTSTCFSSSPPGASVSPAGRSMLPCWC